MTALLSRLTTSSGRGEAVAASPRWGRELLGVLVRPRVTLGRLGQRRAGEWALAVLAVAVVLLTVYAHSYADSYYFYEEQARYYAEHPEAGPAGMLAPRFAPLATVLIRMGERLARLLGAWALWGVGLYVAGALLSSEAPGGAVVRLLLWSWLPYIVRGLVQAAYMALSHDPIFNPGLSGLLVDNTPPAMGQFEYVMVPRSARLGATVLSYVDVYLVWHLALLLIGLPRFTKVPRKWAWVIVPAIALLWIGVNVALDFARYKY